MEKWFITKIESSIPMYVRKHGNWIMLTPGTDASILVFKSKKEAENFILKMKLPRNLYAATNEMKIFNE